MSARRRFVPVTLLLPLLASVLGIDGGALFQILASENLGLGPSAIGIAFGLGIVSVPLQLLAARTPFERAARNLRAFLLVAASLCAVLAALTAFDTRGNVAVVALAVTVAAEIALSTLFAPSAAPLMSATLTSRERQSINSRVRALANALLAGLAVVFAGLTSSWRAGFVLLAGVLAVATCADLRGLTPPVGPEGPAEPTHPQAGTDPPMTLSSPPTNRDVFVVFALLGLAAWPVFVVYASLVLWPSGNPGVVAGTQLAGALVPALAWKPTDRALVGRARRAVTFLAVSGVGLVALRSPVSSAFEVAVLLAVTFAGAASIAVTRIALVEVVHRRVDSSSSVRTWTLLDVVASTSLQAGLLLGGVVVTFSLRTTSWIVDPYRIYLVAGAAAAAATTAGLRSSGAQRENQARG